MKKGICLLLLAMVHVLGCTEDSVVGVVEVAPESCVPNQTFSCPCLKDGIATFGVQTCQPDGISYSPCECSLVPMAPPTTPEEVKEVEDSDTAGPEPDVEVPDVVDEPDVIEPEDTWVDDVEEIPDTTDSWEEPDVEDDVEEVVEADVQPDTDEPDAGIPAVAALQPLPDFVDFAYVKVGNSFVENVVLENVGTDVVTITGMELTGNAGFFAATRWCRLPRSHGYSSPHPSSRRPTSLRDRLAGWLWRRRTHKPPNNARLPGTYFRPWEVPN